jgi:hypothetical protein
MEYGRRQQNANAYRTIQPQAKCKSFPAVPFLKPKTIIQPIVQGYFTYKNDSFKPDEIEKIYRYLAKTRKDIAEQFYSLAKSDDKNGIISKWLRSNKVYTAVSSMLVDNDAMDEDEDEDDDEIVKENEEEEDVDDEIKENEEEEDDDDNISIYSDFEDNDDDRWGKLGGSDNPQFPIFKKIRKYLKEKKGQLKPENLQSLMESLSVYTGYDQATFGFARRMGKRTSDDDRQFGSKLSTLPLKYLAQTLTGKKTHDWYNRKKSNKNENHFEKGIGEQMKEKGKDLNEFEIMISRARCEYCEDDDTVNEFGKIYAKNE